MFFRSRVAILVRGLGGIQIPAAVVGFQREIGSAVIDGFFHTQHSTAGDCHHGVAVFVQLYVAVFVLLVLVLRLHGNAQGVGVAVARCRGHLDLIDICQHGFAVGGSVQVIGRPLHSNTLNGQRGIGAAFCALRVRDGGSARVLAGAAHGKRGIQPDARHLQRSGVIRPDRASLVLRLGHGAHGGQQIPAAVLGLHGKFVGRKGVLNRITRGFGLHAGGAGYLRDQADGFISVLQQRFQLFLQGFEFVCLGFGFGIFPSVDQVHHSVVVGFIFKQIAGDIVGAAVIHGKLHLQSVQKFVLRGGGVGKLYCAYCGRGFAGHHGKLAAGFAVRASLHGAALVSRHRDHAQTQRFALVFFQVDGQVGVRGTRPCFGGGFPDVAVLVLCQQLVVVQCAVGDARPCDLIRQGFGVGVVGQQDAVGRAGLGQAGANARILTGCRCAHGVGAARLGYAGNRKAHGGKVPVRRAVGELVHRHGQRGFRAVRFQGCRARGQVDFHLVVCIGYAVQLVGVAFRTCGVLPSKGIEQIVLVIQLVGCRFAQGGGGYYL